jgi:GT2 family glycosyltransferase
MTDAPSRRQRSRIRAVVPSLAGSPEQLSRLAGELRDAGAEPLVVPTGARVERALAGGGVPVRPIGDNPGFAATIAHGAAGEWDWLLVVNDDVTVDPERLRRHLDLLVGRPAGTRELVFLDSVPPRPVPSRADAVLGLSLVGPVLTRLRLRSTSALAADAELYRPFSFVAVSRALWDELGGLDQSFVYTFEDADFARRARRAGATLSFPDDTGVVHARYGTSTSRIRAVLPCAAASTATYLQSLGVRPGLARAACLAALTVRLPLVVLGDLPRREHAAGIWRAMGALASGARPSLPAYAQN